MMVVTGRCQFVKNYSLSVDTSTCHFRYWAI